jgi:hypothetical protein
MSQSHILLAAAATLSSGPQISTSVFMICEIFIDSSGF